MRYLDECTVIQAGQSILRLVEDTQLKVKVGVPITFFQEDLKAIAASVRHHWMQGMTAFALALLS